MAKHSNRKRMPARILGEEVPGNHRLLHRAFTLVELLVTIAIISILAALLLGALSRSTNSARATICKSNLKQIQLGINGYLIDTDHYPKERNPATGGPGEDLAMWNDRIKPYVGQGWMDKLFLCPSYKGKTVEFELRNLTSPLGSYGYNLDGVGRSQYSATEDSTQYNNLGLGGKITQGSTGPPVITEWRGDDIKMPSDMITVGDAFHSYYQPSKGTYKVESNGGVIGLSSLNYDEMSFGPGAALNPAIQHENPEDRHGGLLNVTFCDGHVEGFKYKKLYLENSHDILRKWNRDHEPHFDRLNR